MALDEQTKLKIIGRIEAGSDLREIVREFKVPYPVIKKIKENLQAEKQKSQIISSIKDKKIIEGEIVKTEKLIENATNEIDNLKILHQEIQETARLALQRIRDLLYLPNLETKELESLVDSLAKLQSAFFKSTNPIVNVINTQQYNEQTLQVFQDLKKP